MLPWRSVRWFEVAALHETNNRGLTAIAGVNLQRRIPCRVARPFVEALLPVCRHEPVTVSAQPTVASAAVAGYAAGSADREFIVTTSRWSSVNR